MSIIGKKLGNAKKHNEKFLSIIDLQGSQYAAI